MIFFNLKVKKRFRTGPSLALAVLILMELLARKLYPLDQTKVMGLQASIDSSGIEYKFISSAIDVPLMLQRLSALVSSLPVQIQMQKIYFHHRVFQVSGLSEGMDGFHFFCKRLSQSHLLKTFQIRHWQEASQLKSGSFRFVMVWR